LGGDENLLWEIIDIFLAETPAKIASLRRSLDLRDADGVEKTAHSLKGELGYLEIPKLSQKARELEQMGRSHQLQHAATMFAAFEDEISAVLVCLRRARGKKPDEQLAVSSDFGSCPAPPVLLYP
jgi:HPt (histidine-containing phosphotransfer) domain-containing protein